MKVQILYNNDAKVDFQGDHGFSVYIRLNKCFLFDTGGNSKLLQKNAHDMDVDLSSIESLILSHDHLDHTGGAKALQIPKKIIIHSGFDQVRVNRLKKTFPHSEIIYNDEPKFLAENVWLSGIMVPGPGEQSIVIKTKDKVVLITGCAHPGIDKIIEYINTIMPFEGKITDILGGFHLCNKNSDCIKEIVHKISSLNVKRVFAGHCTGDKAMNIFAKKYKENFVKLRVGDTFKF